MITASASPSRSIPLLKSSLFTALAAGLLLSACGPPRQKGQLSGDEERAAIAALAAAPEHGLSPQAFSVERLAARLDSGDRAEADSARRELKTMLVAYSRAQQGLAIPRAQMPKAWGIKRADYDAAAELDAAIKAGEFKDWLEQQPRKDDTYEALRLAYATYSGIVAAGGWPVVPGGVMKPDAIGPAVAALRARLAAEDTAVAPEGPFDADLMAALARFQLAHGLEGTGKLDPATLTALNVPAAVRLTQIRANLERLRWLPRESPPTRIDVNIAAATMVYFVDGQEVMSMLAASGKPGDETPMLTSVIDNIVLNPPWNVPEGIAADEILPKGADYLARNDFVIKEDGRLVQQPGRNSALGLVKFDFDNPYAVYLHDTPSKAAFDNARRAVSHGCVRLEKAVPLARLIAAAEPGWSEDRVDAVLASGETTTVKLSRTIPVRLIYLTAFPKDGRIAFRPDVYGWDTQLSKLIDRPGQLAVKDPGPAKRPGG